MSKADEEKKSYSSVFLLAVALLLATAIWIVWDDQISRRPWKKYQYEFSEMQIDRAKAEVTAEQKRLDDSSDYQTVVEELREARQGTEGGETGAAISELSSREAAARIVFDDADFDLRLVKSQIEEAWYEFEHAELMHVDTTGPKHHLEELEAKKVATEARVAEAQARLDQILNEKEEIFSVVETLEKQKKEMESGLGRLEQNVEGLVIPVGPFEFPKIPKIQQVVLNEFDRNAYNQPLARVDRCTSCHTGINKDGFEDAEHPFRTHPDRKLYLGTHSVEKFGCTPCHQGQGPAVNSPEQAHGWVKHWLDPMYQGDDVQAGCIGCHDNVRIEGAETIALGEKLFEQVGCVGCHLVDGYGDLPKIGPYLRRVSAKVDADWLVDWVKNPHEFRPRTKMPNFYFDQAEAEAIAGYILASSAKEGEEWLASHPAPGGIDSSDAALVAKGAELADSLGCRGCHGLAPGESPALLGDSKDIAPNLGNIAEKANQRWMYHWLKNPRGYSPEARMPSLRLSDDEAKALVSYLGTLGEPAGSDDAATRDRLLDADNVAEGEALVRKYGCAGCHNIPGMEAESRIGVELSVFGSKPLEELFFGKRTDIPHTWKDWTYNKINEPRIYETDRIEQVMPHFALSEEDIDAILVFLASRQEAKVPEAYKLADRQREQALVDGLRVIEHYNCVGCHVINDQGGAILARYEENPSLGPPILNGEGAKVQSDWFYSFLKQPVPLRPWLKIRMPTFGVSDDEARKIVEYFAALEGIDSPFVHIDQAALSPEYVEAGKLLASVDYFSCYTCHQQGERKPEGPEEGWAPDLAMASERLNPDWIVEWIKDPQALMPGSRMPAFYDFSDDSPDGPDDVLGGNDLEQVKALRDYLLTLGSMPVAAAPVVADPERVEPAAMDQGTDGTASSETSNAAAPETVQVEG